MNDEFVDAMTQPRTLTPNVASPPVVAVEHGSKTIAVAPGELRSIAQNLIETVDEHKHLRMGGATILMVVERSEATRRKLEGGQRVSIGKASKAAAYVRLLFGETDGDGRAPRRPDFVVRICGDWLDLVADDEDRRAKIVALVDHELCHCGPKVAGKFVDPGRLDAYVADLGDDHLETLADVTDEDGHVLVRSIARDDVGHITWKIRKHDIEEFHGVAQRHGSWDTSLAKLVDVLVEDEPTPLLDAAAG